MPTFHSANLTNANLTGADLRGAQGFVPGSATTTNTILPDGTIKGLHLDSNNPTLLVRNYSGNIPIHILARDEHGFRNIPCIPV